MEAARIMMHVALRTVGMSFAGVLARLILMTVLASHTNQALTATEYGPVPPPQAVKKRQHHIDMRSMANISYFRSGSITRPSAAECGI